MTKLHNKKIQHFWEKKHCNKFVQGSMKAFQTTREDSSPQRRTFSTLKHEISSLFFCVVCHFRHSPNWIRVQTGSGSESPKHLLKGYPQQNSSSFSRTVASKRLPKKHWRNRRERKLILKQRYGTVLHKGFRENVKCQCLVYLSINITPL